MNLEFLSLLFISFSFLLKSKPTRKTSLFLEVNEQVERSEVLYLFWFGEEQLASRTEILTSALTLQVASVFGLSFLV